MTVSAPHYLLFSESQTQRPATNARRPRGDCGQWRFVLETVDGKTRFEAADEEPEAVESRLALLAVVRVLEALLEGFAAEKAGRRHFRPLRRSFEDQDRRCPRRRSMAEGRGHEAPL